MEILKERGKTHGDFNIASKFVQEIKDEARKCPNWINMSKPEREAVDMIIHKLGRWLFGTSHEDHMHDIAGYATLAKENIENNTKNANV